MTPQEQLQKLFELSIKDFVTKKQLTSFLEAVLSGVNKSKEALSKDTEQKHAKVCKMVEDCLAKMEGTEEELEKMVDDLQKSNEKDIETLKRDFLKKLEDIKDLIPNDFDASVIEQRLDEIEAKIEAVPKWEEETGEATVDKINDLEIVPEKQIGIEHIRGLLDRIKKLESRPISGGIGGGIVGRDLIKDIDLSAQLDGVTSTFNIHGVWNIITVQLSSFPYGSLRKNIDYTWTPTSITFTSQIDPATQLAAGQSCILTVVSA